MALQFRQLILSLLLPLIAWFWAVHWIPTLRFVPYAFATGCCSCLAGLFYLVATSARVRLHNTSFPHPTSLKFTSPQIWESEGTALKARLNYRRSTIAHLQPVVGEKLDVLLDLVLRDFVMSWYGKIGRGRHFANEVDHAVRNVIGRMSEILACIDLVEFAVLRILPIINDHLEAFDVAELAVRGKNVYKDVTETEELDIAIAAKYRNGKLHPAASLASARSSAPQQKHLRTLVQSLLPDLLPRNMVTSAAVLAIVREIVACAVFVPVMQALCDSDFVHQQIEAYGRLVLHERKTVRKLRAALDEHTVAQSKDSKILALPKLKPNDTERNFERFVRAIRQCDMLPDARRHRSDISKQLERDISIHSRDPTYLRRLEVGKKLLDQRIDQLQGTRPLSLENVSKQPSTIGRPNRPREAATLREILYDASGLSLFMEYMDRLSLMSYVQFWVVVDGLRGPLEQDTDEPLQSMSWNDSDRQDLAQISSAYFGRPNLKISKVHLLAVQQFLAAGGKATSMQYSTARLAVFKAQDEVFAEMNKRHLANFKRSDLYFRWLASERATSTVQIVPNVSSRSHEISWNSESHARKDLGRPMPSSRPPDLRRAALSSSDLFTASKSMDGEGARRSLDDNQVRRSLFDDNDQNSLGRLSPSINSDTDSVHSLTGQSRAVDAVQQALDDLMAEGADKQDPLSETAELVNLPDLAQTKTPFNSMQSYSPPSSPSDRKPSLASLGLLGTPARRTVFNSDDLFGENEKLWEEGRSESEHDEQTDEDDGIHEAAPGDLGLAEVVQGLTLEVDKLEAQQSVVSSLTGKAELTNNTAELRILRKSKASLDREIRRKELQRQRYLVAESENALFGKAMLSIKNIMVGTEPDGHEFALYVIEVQRQNTGQQPIASWAIARRYSEFHELHKRLRARFPSLRETDFPRRQMVLTLQKDFLKKRRAALEKYLRQLLTIPVICRSIEFRAFLSQQAIRTQDGADGSQIDRQDFVTRIYNSVTDGMEEFLGNVPVLDQLSLAGQNLISAATFAVPSPSGESNTPITSIIPESGFSTSNDPTATAEAAAEISAFEAQQQAEGEVKNAKAQRQPTTFIAPIATAFQTLFQLTPSSSTSSNPANSNTSYSHYLRGRAVVVILQQLLGGTVERRVRDSFRTYTSGESLARHISQLTTALWPADDNSADGHGPMRSAPARRSAKERAQSRREAGVVLAALSVDVAGAVVGRSRAADAGRRIGRCLGNERLNASLMFEIVDEVVAVVFGA